MVVVDEKTAALAVSKGDSACFSITFEGNIPADGTETLFTVKRKIGGPASILKHYTVKCGTVEVELESKDTNKLEPGDYYWDLRLILSEREVVTPMVPCRFRVLWAAGDV